MDAGAGSGTVRFYRVDKDALVNDAVRHRKTETALFNILKIE
jgi:hypothetical protein